MHPVLFEIGNFPIFSYGALVAAAVFISFVYARWAAPKFGLDRERAGGLVFVVLRQGLSAPGFFMWGSIFRITAIVCGRRFGFAKAGWFGTGGFSQRF